MQKLSRREALRGTGVAALAAAAMMPLVVGGAVADAGTDPLFNVLNRFKAELATFDAYDASLDEAHRRRAEAILREAVDLPAQAASAALVLDMVLEEELLNSIYEDQFIGLLKTARAYIASTAEVRS